MVGPFARLARAHAVAVAGDTLVAIALAGTLFFSIDVTEARSEVFLYLALTMAPFAVVAPLVGPALDRAVVGRRWIVVAWYAKDLAEDTADPAEVQPNTFRASA